MVETGDMRQRIESAIDKALANARAEPAPGRLSEALDYAVRPGGARIRPRMLLSVAIACGDDQPGVSDAAAAALELVHCASLVHDDLPCFDNAGIRRGKPSVHHAYSEALAVLAGSSLIMTAYEALARTAAQDPARTATLVLTLAQKSGMPGGICAGQGWESEARIDLTAYHRSKTGALFVAATQMGAIAAGHDPEPWAELGSRVGEAYQVPDDLRDMLMGVEMTGKPSDQVARMGRPNAAAELGVAGAIKQLADILGAAASVMPACPGRAWLERVMAAEADEIMSQFAGRQHPRQDHLVSG